MYSDPDPAEARRAYGEQHYPLQQLTRETIGAFLHVYADFGYGFLETPYRRATAVELRYRGLQVREEVPFELVHRGVHVGHYRADLIVESALLIEVKAGLVLDPAAAPQLLNYLKASRLPVGLILHAGPRPGIKRIVASRGVLENVR